MLAKDRVVVSKIWSTGYWLWSWLFCICDCWKSMKNCRDSSLSLRGFEARLPAFQLPMFAKYDALKEICSTCLSNGIHAFLWNLNFHSLPVAWGSWEPQHAPPVLDYGCFMPIPSLQLQKKSCLMQRSGGFGHGVVVSKICYNLLIVLLCDCCKLLAFVGWKRGCQPFSLPTFAKAWRTAERRFFIHVCLKESMAFCWNLSLHSNPALWLHHSHPCVAAAKKDLSHAKKQRVWSRSCGVQDLDMRLLQSQGTLVEIELLATVGWKWGCQPFSHRGSQNVTHCPKEICSTCLSNPPFLLRFPSIHSLPEA